MEDSRIAPRDLADSLLSRGIPWVTLSQAAAELGTSQHQATSTLTRLRRQGRIFSPHPGLYFAVPPEYRTWRALPATDFIDAVMQTVGHHYYVAYLSAAELHGAAHQRPQICQVVSSAPVKDREFGRVQVRFYERKDAERVPTLVRTTATGSLRVATPAATVLDLVTWPLRAGGLSNVATVLSELVEETGLTADQLTALTDLYPESSLRRLGFLLELVEAPVDTDAVRAALPEVPKTLTRLDAKGVRRGRREQRWGLIVNHDVEPDL